MSATFTGAGCRPTKAGETLKAVLLRCPVCFEDRPSPPVVHPVLWIADVEERGRVWFDRDLPYVCVGVEQEAAILALIDHLDRAHDASQFLGKDFGASFEQAGITSPESWQALLRRVKA